MGSYIIYNNLILLPSVFFLTLLLPHYSASQDTDSLWTVQIISSASLADVETYMEKIPEVESRIERIKRFYTLRSGLFKEKKEAEELKSLLESKGIKNTLLRKCYYIPERIVRSKNFKEKEEKGNLPAKISAPTSKPYKITVEAPSEVVTEEHPLTTSEMKTDKPPEKTIPPQKEIEDLLNRIKIRLKNKNEEQRDKEAIRALFSCDYGVESPSEKEYIIKQGKRDLESLKKGIHLRGQVYHTEGFIWDEILTNSRGYVGLEWDIFRDGYMQHLKKKKALSEELIAESYLLPQRLKKERYPLTRTSIIYLFNQKKKKILEEQIDFLSQYLITLRNLYSLNLIPHQELSQFEKRLCRAKNFYEGYQKYEANIPNYIKEKLSKLSPTLLPVVDVDIDKIKKEIASPLLREKVLNHRKEALRYRYESDYEYQIKPYARIYFEENGSSSNYLMLGVLGSLQLPFGAKKKEKVRTDEESLIEADYDRVIRDNLHDVVNSYYEYTYKMDDLLNFLFQKEIIANNLKKEIEKYRVDNYSFSFLKTGRYFADYMDTEFEISHIKQLLYLTLLFIYQYIPEQEDITPYIIPLSMVKKIKRCEQRNIRAVYIWSEEFNGIDNNSLVESLRRYSVNTVLVSFSKKTDKEKLRQFINTAGNEFSIHSLLGDNSLLLDKNKIEEKISEMAGYDFAGVHIDVEPHTFDDWEEKKEDYMRRFTALLERTRNNKFMEDKRISISIVPVFYTPDFISKIASIVDKIYIMAYGTKNKETIIRWTEDEIKIGKDRLVIALRPEDFKDEMEISSLILSLQEEEIFNSFAFHSLTGLLRKGEQE